MEPVSHSGTVVGSTPAPANGPVRESELEVAALPVRQSEREQLELARQQRTHEEPATVDLIVGNYAFLAERNSAHGQTLGLRPLTPVALVGTTVDPLATTSTTTETERQARFDLIAPDRAGEIEPTNFGQILPPRAQAQHFMTVLARVSRDELQRSQCMDQFERLIYHYEQIGLLRTDAKTYLENFRHALALEIKELHGGPEYAEDQQKYAEVLEKALVVDEERPFVEQRLTHRAIIAWYTGNPLTTEHPAVDTRGIERIRSSNGFVLEADGNETGSLGVCEVDGQLHTIHAQRSADGKTFSLALRLYDKPTRAAIAGLDDPIGDRVAGERYLKQCAREFAELARDREPSTIPLLFNRFVESKANPYTTQIQTGHCLNPSGLREREAQFRSADDGGPGWLELELRAHLVESFPALASSSSVALTPEQRAEALEAVLQNSAASALAWEHEQFGYPTDWKNHRLVDRRVHDALASDAGNVSETDARRYALRLRLEQITAELLPQAGESNEAFAERVIATATSQSTQQGKESEFQLAELNAAQADLIALARTKHHLLTKAQELVAVFALSDAESFKERADSVLSTLPLSKELSAEQRTRDLQQYRSLVLEVLKRSAPAVHSALVAPTTSTTPARADILADPIAARVEQVVRGVRVEPLIEYARSIHTICGNCVLYGTDDQAAPRLRYGARIRGIEELVVLDSDSLTLTGRADFNLAEARYNTESKKWEYPKISEPDVQAANLVKQLITISPGDRAILWERFCGNVHEYFRNQPNPGVTERLVRDPIRGSAEAQEFIRNVLVSLPDAIQEYRREPALGLSEQTDIKRFLQEFVGPELLPDLSTERLSALRRPHIGASAAIPQGFLTQEGTTTSGVVGIYSTDSYSASVQIELDEATGRAKIELAPLNVGWRALTGYGDGNPKPARDEREYRWNDSWISEFGVLARFVPTSEVLKVRTEYRDSCAEAFRVVQGRPGVSPEMREFLSSSGDRSSFIRASRLESEGRSNEIPIDEVEFVPNFFKVHSAIECHRPNQSYDLERQPSERYTGMLAAMRSVREWREIPAVEASYEEWFDAQTLAGLDEATRRLVTSPSTVSPFSFEQIGDPIGAHRTGTSAERREIDEYHRHCADKLVQYLGSLDFWEKPVEERRGLAFAIWTNYGRMRSRQDAVSVDETVDFMLSGSDPAWKSRAPFAEDPYILARFADRRLPEQQIQAQLDSALYRGTASAQAQAQYRSACPTAKGSHFQEVLAMMKQHHPEMYTYFLCVSPADAYPFEKLAFINKPTSLHVGMVPIEEQEAAQRECYQSLAHGLAYHLQTVPDDADLAAESFKFLNQVTSVYSQLRSTREYDLIATLDGYGVQQASVGASPTAFGGAEVQLLGDSWARREAAQFFQALPENVFRELRLVDAEAYTRVGSQLKSELRKLLVEERSRYTQGQTSGAILVLPEVVGINRAIAKLDAFQISTDPESATLPGALYSILHLEAPQVYQSITSRFRLQRDEFASLMQAQYEITEPNESRKDVAVLSEVLKRYQSDAQRATQVEEIRATAEQLVLAQLKHLRMLERRRDDVGNQLVEIDQLLGSPAPSVGDGDTPVRTGTLARYVDSLLAKYDSVQAAVDAGLQRGVVERKLLEERAVVLDDIKLWVGSEFLDELHQRATDLRTTLSSIAADDKPRVAAFRSELVAVEELIATWDFDSVRLARAWTITRLKQAQEAVDDSQPGSSERLAQISQSLKLEEAQADEHARIRAEGREVQFEKFLVGKQAALTAEWNELSRELQSVRAQSGEVFASHIQPLVEHGIGLLRGEQFESTKRSVDGVLEFERQASLYIDSLVSARQLGVPVAADIFEKTLAAGFSAHLRDVFSESNISRQFAGYPEGISHWLRGEFTRAEAVAVKLGLTSCIQKFRDELVSSTSEELQKNLAELRPEIGRSGIDAIRERCVGQFRRAEAFGIHDVLQNRCQGLCPQIEQRIEDLNTRIRSLVNPREQEPLIAKRDAFQELLTVLRAEPEAPREDLELAMDAVPTMTVRPAGAAIALPAAVMKMTDPVGTADFWSAWDLLVDHRSDAALEVQNRLTELQGDRKALKQEYATQGRPDLVQMVDVLDIRRKLLGEAGSQRMTITELASQCESQADRDYVRRIGVMLLLREAVGDRTSAALAADPAALAAVRSELLAHAKREQASAVRRGDAETIAAVNKVQELVIEQLSRSIDWYVNQPQFEQLLEHHVDALQQLRIRHPSDHMGRLWERYFEGDPISGQPLLMTDFYAQQDARGLYANESRQWVDEQRVRYGNYMIAHVARHLREQATPETPNYSAERERMYLDLATHKAGALYAVHELAPGGSAEHRERYLNELARAFQMRVADIEAITEDIRTSEDSFNLAERYVGENRPWLCRLLPLARQLHGSENPHQTLAAAVYASAQVGGFRHEIAVPVVEYHRQGRIDPHLNLVQRLVETHQDHERALRREFEQAGFGDIRRPGGQTEPSYSGQGTELAMRVHALRFDPQTEQVLLRSWTSKHSEQFHVQLTKDFLARLESERPELHRAVASAPSEWIQGEIELNNSILQTNREALATATAELRSIEDQQFKEGTRDQNLIDRRHQLVAEMRKYQLEIGGAQTSLADLKARRIEIALAADPKWFSEEMSRLQVRAVELSTQIQKLDAELAPIEDQVMATIRSMRESHAQDSDVEKVRRNYRIEERRRLADPLSEAKAKFNELLAEQAILEMTMQLLHPREFQAEWERRMQASRETAPSAN